MADGASKQKPGDFILDRYMSDASEAEREAARANLYSLLEALVRLEECRARENVESEIRQNDGGALDSVDGATAPKS